LHSRPVWRTLKPRFVLSCPDNRRSWQRYLLLAVLVALRGSGQAAASAESEIPEARLDIAAQEAQVEALWAAALETSDSDPMRKLGAWGSVFQAETSLEWMRMAARGVEDRRTLDTAAVTERVLARWRRLEPESGGPDLFATLLVQDPQEQQEAILALLDDHPDDALVISQATQRLQQSGESRRAKEVLENFLIRNPRQPAAYSLLASHYSNAGNETRLAEVLGGWAEIAPDDPKMVSHWFATQLPVREPEASLALLDRFLATRPTGHDALNACLRVARQNHPPFKTAAHACVAKLAADPDPASPVAERATAALAEMAVAEDDWSGFEAALRVLGPEARLHATIGAARGLEAPNRCEERVDLLLAVLEEMSWTIDSPGSVASALMACAARPSAQAVYLELMRRARASDVDGVIRGWAFNVNGEWRGDLPTGAVGRILESRLESYPESEYLFRALDIVYQLGGETEKRFALLRRWQRLLPASFRGEQAIALADELMMRGDHDGAIGVLEAQLEQRLEQDVAEQLWGLYLAAGDGARAERFGEDLISSGERHRVSIGHVLAARSAFLRQDFAGAERHYWSHLGGEFARKELATELLGLIQFQGGAERLPELARRICEETRINGAGSGVAKCASDLLATAGSGDVAAGLLAERAADMPEDLPALRELADTASKAGQPEVAESALRRAVELDPTNANDWIRLAMFLEKQGRLEDLEALLASAREAFSPPPHGLLRTVGKAYLAAHQPRRAIDLLREARNLMPTDSDPAWINAELRDAYRALGQEQE
jgi:tetratricopeptide (TPR) repeat protein